MKYRLVGSVIILLLVVALLWYNMPQTTPTYLTHMFPGGYEVVEIKNLLSPKECNILMSAANSKGLADSSVWGYDSNVLHEDQRKSTQAWLPDSTNTVCKKLADVAAKLSRKPVEFQEDLQVVRYDTQGMFHGHYDACDDPNSDSCKAMNNGGGQRLYTLLVYLNDDFSGGQTTFPKIGYVTQPKAGNAIFFRNVDDADIIIPDSFHQANKVLNGNKWIATKWVHSTKYNRP